MKISTDIQGVKKKLRISRGAMTQKGISLTGGTDSFWKSPLHKHKKDSLSSHFNGLYTKHILCIVLKIVTRCQSQ